MRLPELTWLMTNIFASISIYSIIWKYIDLKKLLGKYITNQVAHSRFADMTLVKLMLLTDLTQSPKHCNNL